LNQDVFIGRDITFLQPVSGIVFTAISLNGLMY